MTKIQDADPINFQTQPNENRGQKQRVGKGVILAIAGVGILAFVIYMAMIVITTTQS